MMNVIGHMKSEGGGLVAQQPNPSLSQVHSVYSVHGIHNARGGGIFIIYQ